MPQSKILFFYTRKKFNRFSCIRVKANHTHTYTSILNVEEKEEVSELFGAQLIHW